jgi:MFS transporter, SHS family, lactate transporter
MGLYTPQECISTISSTRMEGFRCRFPTEVRATASGFCYHQGAIWAGFTGPLLALFAATQPLGFAVPMLVSTVGAALVFVVTLLLSPETKGKALVSQLSLAA